MPDTTAQVRAVVALLRADGFKVIEVPGWERRGKGPMTTKGRVEHHTATRSTADAPTLRVVTHGHGTLTNSLSRWYVSRSGVIYLIALNTSWHAGKGIKGTNSVLSGTEAEHSGSTKEPWTPGSLNSQAAISRAESKVFGFPLDNVWDHKEHAPRRKVDRAGIDPKAWRHRLTQPCIGQTPLGKKLTRPATPQPPEPSEDDMAKLDEEAQEFYQAMFDDLKKKGARPTSLGNVLVWMRRIREIFS